MKIARSFRLWALAFLCVAALALVVAPNGGSEQGRIAHLETLVKCPSCDDLSVAQSNATSALAVRSDITKRVHEGQSDSRILTSLESTYGTSILLSPSTSGVGALLWLVPIGALVALMVSAVRLSRRR
ncbi:MAG TPA: cytochrome c-type biogenesis protein CcmH [Acidimicrobiales bacterium]